MTDPMRIGLMTFVTDQSMPLTPLAREAEGRGFESLFVPEKTHLPVSRRTPWPGGDLPETYKRTYDPFVSLATAAAVTSTLKLGTGSCIALTRDPIITAKGSRPSTSCQAPTARSTPCPAAVSKGER
jgi:alkanesulfonate monooxygenase SsuD/methylene tetrahydromethanopterin reductase-like flavin-dependent oxidoreductase (luciferase family)